MLIENESVHRDGSECGYIVTRISWPAVKTVYQRQRISIRGQISEIMGARLHIQWVFSFVSVPVIPHQDSIHIKVIVFWHLISPFSPFIAMQGGFWKQSMLRCTWQISPEMPRTLPSLAHAPQETWLSHLTGHLISPFSLCAGIDARCAAVHPCRFLFCPEDRFFLSVFLSCFWCALRHACLTVQAWCCCVLQTTERIAKKYGLDCHIYCNARRVLETKYATLHMTPSISK